MSKRTVSIVYGEKPDDTCSIVVEREHCRATSYYTHDELRQIAEMLMGHFLTERRTDGELTVAATIGDDNEPNGLLIRAFGMGATKLGLPLGSFNFATCLDMDECRKVQDVLRDVLTVRGTGKAEPPLGTYETEPVKEKFRGETMMKELCRDIELVRGVLCAATTSITLNSSCSSIQMLVERIVTILRAERDNAGVKPTLTPNALTADERTILKSLLFGWLKSSSPLEGQFSHADVKRLVTRLGIEWPGLKECDEMFATSKCDGAMANVGVVTSIDGMPPGSLVGGSGGSGKTETMQDILDEFDRDAVGGVGVDGGDAEAVSRDGPNFTPPGNSSFLWAARMSKGVQATRMQHPGFHVRSVVVKRKDVTKTLDLDLSLEGEELTVDLGCAIEREPVDTPKVAPWISLLEKLKLVARNLAEAAQGITYPDGHIWHGHATSECTGECEALRKALADYGTLIASSQLLQAKLVPMGDEGDVIVGTYGQVVKVAE